MYSRSGTIMDNAAAFFPQTFLNGPRRLGRLSRLGDMQAPFDYATDYGVDPAASYPLDYAWDGSVAAPAPDASSGGGFDWQGALKQAPAVLRDLYIAQQTGNATAKVLEINATRAKQGLPPLDPAQYAPSPRVDVGIAPKTMQQIGTGVGLVALIAAGAWAMSRSRRRR